MITEEQKQAELIKWEAEARAENSRYGKAHLKIKSSKGKFASNRQPPKKKRK